jgi:uncharacterized protein (TIGR03435 family)
MQCSWQTFVVLAAGPVLAHGQDSRPAYEAASVKPNTSFSNSSSSHGSKGQVVFTNQSLKRYIERAYNVKPFQVMGPDWMESVNFDITAKYPPETKDAERPMMLRTLLEDRFKLAIHRESKEMPGYSLVLAKGGFKLKPVEAGGSSTDSHGGRVRILTAKKTSMAQLADLVSRYLGELVMDKTGVEGVYDFEFRWMPDDQAANGGDAETAPSLFTALGETIGVRLQRQKVPMDVIVVDHVERVPSEN